MDDSTPARPPAPGTGDAAGKGRKPYTRPVLKVFGSVAGITATLSMSGMLKDGGPNNVKT
jgi:hypothetical protein